MNKAVSAAVRAAANSCKEITHYVPCHLGHATTPAEFSIGPVRFRQRDATLNALDGAFHDYVSNGGPITHDDQSREQRLKRNEADIDHVRTYYASFGWIAEVTISQSDPEMSRRRANRLVQAGLDCLHILIGRGYSHHMRIGGSNFHTDRRGHFEMREGALALSYSVDWRGHHLGDEWWQDINRNGGDQIIALMGEAMIEGFAPVDPAPLAKRFLDAAAWYGEAVRDEFRASRLVKYVTALGRLLTTKKNEKDLAKILITRGAALIFRPEVDDLPVIRKRFSAVYDLRSQLVHGTKSPLNIEYGSGLRDAEEIARAALIQYLGFCGASGLKKKDVSFADQDRAFDHIIRWSEDPSNCERLA